MATATRTAHTTDPHAATARRTDAVNRSTGAQRADTTGRQTAAANAWRQNAAARQAAQRHQSMTPVARAGGIAEKAVLVPVGAALTARDSIVATIGELRARYSTRYRAEQELRRFERRGTRALKDLERDVKRAASRAAERITGLA